MTANENAKAASADEMKTAFAGPAPFADRVFASFGPGGVRLAFIEQEPNGGACHFRGAVTMHPGAALELAQMLMNAIVPVPAAELQGGRPVLN